MRIELAIRLIRGFRVLLDADLAELYEVETKALTRAVKRNADRFPTDFMFQLTEEEFANLRHQGSTDEQRCWVHKIANALDKLPKRLQSNAKGLLHEVMNAETAADANEALEQYEIAFGAKYEKSVDCLKKDWRTLTRFFSYPALQWTHLRTTNPIESTFATVKLRTNVTKGAGSPNAAATMAFKQRVIQSQLSNWAVKFHKIQLAVSVQNRWCHGQY